MMIYIVQYTSEYITRDYVANYKRLQTVPLLTRNPVAI